MSKDYTAQTALITIADAIKDKQDNEIALAVQTAFKSLSDAEKQEVSLSLYENYTQGSDAHKELAKKVAGIVNYWDSHQLIHLITSTGSTEVIKGLQDAGISLVAKQQDGTYPEQKIVQESLFMDIGLSARNDKKEYIDAHAEKIRSALDVYWESVKDLFQNNPEEKAKFLTESSFLRVAAFYGNLEVVEDALKGLDNDKKNQLLTSSSARGETALSHILNTSNDPNNEMLQYCYQNCAVLLSNLKDNTDAKDTALRVLTKSHNDFLVNNTAILNEVDTSHIQFKASTTEDVAAAKDTLRLIVKMVDSTFTSPNKSDDEKIETVTNAVLSSVYLDRFKDDFDVDTLKNLANLAIKISAAKKLNCTDRLEIASEDFSSKYDNQIKQGLLHILSGNKESQSFIDAKKFIQEDYKDTLLNICKDPNTSKKEFETVIRILNRADTRLNEEEAVQLAKDTKRMVGDYYFELALESIGKKQVHLPNDLDKSQLSLLQELMILLTRLVNAIFKTNNINVELVQNMTTVAGFYEGSKQGKEAKAVVTLDKKEAMLLQLDHYKSTKVGGGRHP